MGGNSFSASELFDNLTAAFMSTGSLHYIDGQKKKQKSTE